MIFVVKTVPPYPQGMYLVCKQPAISFFVKESVDELLGIGRCEAISRLAQSMSTHMQDNELFFGNFDPKLK